MFDLNTPVFSNKFLDFFFWGEMVRILDTSISDICIMHWIILDRAFVYSICNMFYSWMQLFIESELFDSVWPFLELNYLAQCDAPTWWTNGTSELLGSASPAFLGPWIASNCLPLHTVECNISIHDSWWGRICRQQHLVILDPVQSGF